MNKPTPEQIVVVAQRHVDMYKRRIEISEKREPGHKNVSLEECRSYYAIWTSIVKKEGKDLSERESDEVEDALFSGEFDEPENNGDE